MDLDRILQTNPSYEQAAKQAEYLFRSYVGGETYRAGQYLTHYIGEQTGPGDQYSKRLASTPLDNHVQTTVDIYRSFLFQENPSRQLGVLWDNPLVNQWVNDTDQEGQNINSFLKTANDLAMVMGSVWILVDKPSYKVQTQAQEQQLGIRAYAAVYNPMNVLDWRYERNIAGKLILNYIKVRESNNADSMVITEWTPSTVDRYHVSKDSHGEPEMVLEHRQYENPIGYVPFVHHAPVKSVIRGVGHSLVADVADSQRYIYNLLSELEQTIRISGHPTLVKTKSTSAAAGAGAIINMDIDTDPGLRPYLLQPTAAGVNGILDTIELVSDSIKRMTHTSAVTTTRTQATSGVSLQVERQLLHAKLTDIADTLQETELRLWKIWFDWQGITPPADFSIDYNTIFDMRDNQSEIQLYSQALDIVPQESFRQAIYEDIARRLIEDTETLDQVIAEIRQPITGQP